MGVSAAASATSLQPTVSGGYSGGRFRLWVLAKIRVTGHGSCQVCW